MQEKLPPIDFVSENLSGMEPVMPLPLEETPFKFVQEVKDLKELVAKLRSVEEFAVNFFSDCLLLVQCELHC